MAEAISDYELLRQKNLKELEAFVCSILLMFVMLVFIFVLQFQLASSLDSTEFKEAIQSVNVPKNKITRKRKRREEFQDFIPVETRRSARLSEITSPNYNQVCC